MLKSFVHFLLKTRLTYNTQTIQKQYTNNTQTIHKQYTNNTQTSPSVSRDLQGTRKYSESSVIYLIYLILLSHLQLIRPLYEQFLEIMIAHCCV